MTNRTLQVLVALSLISASSFAAKERVCARQPYGIGLQPERLLKSQQRLFFCLKAFCMPRTGRGLRNRFSCGH